MVIEIKIIVWILWIIVLASMAIGITLIGGLVGMWWVDRQKAKKRKMREKDE